jgi:transcriptional/translational regulatory protein YebC/TACO1
LNKEELEERAMELPIADFETEENTAVVYADKKDFATVQDGLEKFHYHMVESDIQFIPENIVKLNEEATNKLYTLLDALEDDEDVDHVRHNMGN